MVFKKLRKKLKLGKFKRTGEVLLTKTTFKKKTAPRPSPKPSTKPKKKSSSSRRDVIRLDPRTPQETITQKIVPPKEGKLPFGKGGSTEFRKAAGLKRTIASTLTDAQRNIGIRGTSNTKERLGELARAVGKNLKSIITADRLRKSQREKDEAEFEKIEKRREKGLPLTREEIKAERRDPLRDKVPFKDTELAKIIGPPFGPALKGPGGENILAGTLPIGPAGAAATGKAAIDISKSLVSKFGQIGKKIDVNKIGKALKLSKAQTAQLATQVGRERINLIARFAVNPKSSILTTGLFIKLGLTIGAASLFKDAVGTYPFAGFLKEEAVQTVSFGYNAAKQNGDLQGMIEATNRMEEIVNAERNIIDLIPYANVQKQVKEFIKSARVSLEIFQREIAELQSGAESKFEQTRRESDESAKIRDLEQIQLESQYFALVKEGKIEEANELIARALKEAKLQTSSVPEKTKREPKEQDIIRLG